MPFIPRSLETLPSLIFPPSARNKSSQCAVTVRPSSSASCIASAINFVFTTGLPSSERAIIPASLSAGISVISSLFKPLVIAPTT